MLSIHNYESPNKFLKDKWSQMNEKNPKFSLRSWAKRMGFQSASPLSLMMSGHRGIPKAHIPRFIRDLGLDENEGQYFETLVDLQRAKSPELRLRYYSQLKKLSPCINFEIVELEEFSFLKDPLHTFILEMTSLKDFIPDSKWICSRLIQKYKLDQVEEALSRLLRMKLLQKKGKKFVAKSQEHITNKPDIRNIAAQNYHQKICELASNAVIQQGVLEREFNSFSMNIRKQDLPAAKQLIRDFVKNFIKNIEAKSSEGEETYQLSVQFFGATNLEGLK